MADNGKNLGKYLHKAKTVEKIRKAQRTEEIAQGRMTAGASKERAVHSQGFSTFKDK